MRTCTRLINPPKGRSWGGGEQMYFSIVTEWAQCPKTQPVWDIISSALGSSCWKLYDIDVGFWFLDMALGFKGFSI